jgi:beta-glucosidase
MKARMQKSVLVACALVTTVVGAQTRTEPFRWGAASAAYQVEGATLAEGRGRSIWDVYLDEKSLAGPGVSGATAINFYNRKQYLEDIKEFKKLGLDSYRFSISWTRILPDGLGPVNPAAVAHYRQFILDLKAAGIRPMLTVYHWDMPASLAAAGGWSNPESVSWFEQYADAVFANFVDLVDLFVLVNEPSVEYATKTMAEQRIAGDRNATLAIVPDDKHVADALTTFNHILLASAAATKSFRDRGHRGRLGLAVPLFPTLTSEDASDTDRSAARLADGILNRWFLDPMFKGSYPEDVLALAKQKGLDVDALSKSAATIGAAKFDFLGVNYYSPLFIRQRSDIVNSYGPEIHLPAGTYAAFNGAVRPDQFTSLLQRIQKDYGNPAVYVTENGAGFEGEDVLKNGQVRDLKRCRYFVDHVAAMKVAIAGGADVRGYHVWSSHDNLEWLSGYNSRFGMIYVDYNTQKRTPKLSATVYSKLLKNEPIDIADCGK